MPVLAILRYLCGLLLLACCCQSVLAANPIAAIDSGSKLISGFGQRLIARPSGFLWIATDAGLNRFDGYNNLLIGADSAQLKSLAFTQLLLDKKQRLWALAPRSGLYAFDPAKAQYFCMALYQAL